MKTIKKTYQIKSSIENVWQALIDPAEIKKWGAGPVKMNEEIGFEFSLWGGDIHGKNVEVVKNKKLVQDWYAGNWPKASIATFDLKKISGNRTKIDFVHQDVPDSEVDEIDDGWDKYYLGAINFRGLRVLGFVL